MLYHLSYTPDELGRRDSNPQPTDKDNRMTSAHLLKCQEIDAGKYLRPGLSARHELAGIPSGAGLEPTLFV